MRTALVLLLSASPARAAFEDLGSGARALGMGGSCAAVSDDMFGWACNPAGPAQARNAGVGMSYERGFDSPVGPLDAERFSGSLQSPVGFDDWPGTLSAGARENTLAGGLHDREAALSYALKEFDRGAWGRLDLGATARVFHRSADGVPDELTRLGGDGGLMWRQGAHAIGVSALNIGNPDMTFAGAKDRGALAVKAGYAQNSPGLVLTTDLTQRMSSALVPGNYTWSVGAERSFPVRSGALALRLGLSAGNRSRAAGIGAGCRMLGLSADYAAVIPAKEERRAGHAFTLTLRFGLADPLGEYERLLKAEIENQRELSQALLKLSVRIAQLTQDLEMSRGETEQLRARLAEAEKTAAAVAAAASSAPPKTAPEAERRRLEAALARLRAEAQRLEREKLESAFRSDWAEYQKMKAIGAPREAVKGRLEHILSAYQDKGLDLSGPRQEMVRLLKD